MNRKKRMQHPKKKSVRVSIQVENIICDDNDNGKNELLTAFLIYYNRETRNAVSTRMTKFYLNKSGEKCSTEKSEDKKSRPAAFR